MSESSSEPVPQKRSIHDAIKALDLAALKEILAATPEAANECNAEGLTPLMVLGSFVMHANIRNIFWANEYSALRKLGLVPQDASESVVRNKALQITENMAKAVIACPAVDLNAMHNPSQMTALHFAALHNNEDVINLLIDAKANLNAQDKDGKTAVMETSFSLRRALVYAGCDLMIQDKYGNNVMHYILGNKVPDTPSSRLITSYVGQDILHVKNQEGRTPQELAEETAKEVAARFEADAKADMLRKKREWEGAFAPDPIVSDLQLDNHEYVSSVQSSHTHNPESFIKLQPQKKKKSWWRRLFSCCCRGCCSGCCVTVPTPAPAPAHSLTEEKKTNLLTLNANHLIYGQGTKPTERLERPKDVLLRSDEVKGEFVPHAGPCLGSYEDICGDDAEKEYYTTNVRDEWPPRPAASVEVPPLHRQTNFTSEQEQQPEHQPEPEQPSQLEKEMDEVFSILRAPATQPQPQQPTQILEPPAQSE